ncbi:cytochrome P450 [Variovorax sp. J22G21]|uniref:bifunctional cytochrome P450/NADPH--P450 reductase n=1 Tax=Variovorax fucosicus TaxID=3053517 RepID=UPI0025775560|nr:MULTISPECIES: cytochrome P450 [unclassified Variovorax]MDM0041443.1 cytochrome P450 [Variovorax sp. J22R193]MDM0060499.1 cytochrome P450 [Variovorax sp. J22G21]
MSSHNPLHPIPHPPKKPFVGNLLSIGSDSPVLDMWKIAQELGGIYWLDMPGMPVIVVSSPELVDELCDEKRFDKSTRGALRRLRAASHGLFTSDTDEPTWSKPHNILLANFSQRAMQAYHPMMLDIAEQLVTKWERLNFDDEVDVTRDMTALTLDTIGLCGFGYRFNSFYREGFHPFVDAMVRTLETVQDRRGLPLEELMMKKQLSQQRKDIRFMHRMVEDIIRERRQSGADIAAKPDLLSYMIAGVDKKSGEKLDDKMIRDECIEFLIAGHETTSGLLSFATYFLIKNPHVLAEARAEVDSVLGTDLSARPTYAQVNRLQYIQQVLKEALRLYPTAPAIAKRALEDTVIGGQYTIKKKNMIIMHALALHRDKRVWGEDANEFNPEHFSREAERALPPNAFKPFGNGQRACIGRQFAMQEAVLTLAMVLQRFDLVDHANYQLKVKEALTIKPEGFKIRVKPRDVRHRAPAAGQAGAAAATAAAQPAAAVASASKHGTPLLVLHGSNLGTAEDLARQIAEEGETRGFAVELASLDDFTANLPANGAVVVVSASYNGVAPDNAAGFWSWVKSTDASMAGVKFSVFGCGNRDWASTYQVVPRSIDERLDALGGQRVHPRGEGDAREDMDGAFQGWSTALWPALAGALKLKLDADGPRTEPLLAFDLVPPAGVPSPAVAQGFTKLEVAANEELQNEVEGLSDTRSTRHVEFLLPEGVSYRAGDHLSVAPRNSAALVERVMQRFGFAKDAYISLRTTAGRKTFLPLDQPISVIRLLGEFVELQDVASRKHIATLAEHTQCPFTKPKLLALTGTDEAASALYKAEVLQKRKSVFDLLDEFPAAQPPFEVVLEMLAPLAPRYYSISSSPEVDPQRCSLTVGVVQGAARSGQGHYEGVCSNHVLRLRPGETVHALVKEPTVNFRLPSDAKRPVIMIGPGTGLAPFRGFLQERAALRQRGTELGDAMLFFGCRHPAQDFIYADQLKGWADGGVVDLHVAFSRDGDRKTYVQDLVREQGAKVWKLIEGGAVIYVCGDGSRMEPDVRRTLTEIARTIGRDGQSDEWIERMTSEQRYVTDVWTGS